jgi:hypothetical protein
MYTYKSSPTTNTLTITKGLQNRPSQLFDFTIAPKMIVSLQGVNQGAPVNGET